MEDKLIYITFDVRTDSFGRDPDSNSKTLRQYHKILWSKTLPSGNLLTLEDNIANTYLYHKSEIGEFYLASDSVIHTYRNWVRTKHIISQIPTDEMDYFYNLAYTIGGFMIFPGNRINGLRTINQERGMNKWINDRIDLTLECIRRFYNNEISPLYETINRYKDFFSLFNDFKGYCEFFLLQDLVNDDFTSVRFFLPFTEFVFNPLPKDVDEYYIYKSNNINFLIKRNKRIEFIVS